MDSDDILMLVGALIIVVALSFVGGVSTGLGLGIERGAECILAGHKVTEEYECIEIDKLRGIDDEL